MVRHVEVWTVFKVSLLFWFIVGIVLLVAGIVVWNVISALGWIDQLESSLGEAALGDLELRSGTVLRAGIMLDIVAMLTLTFFSTLLAVLYNLISDVVGGVTFIDEQRLTRRDVRLRQRRQSEQQAFSLSERDSAPKKSRPVAPAGSKPKGPEKKEPVPAATAAPQAAAARTASAASVAPVPPKRS